MTGSEPAVTFSFTLRSAIRGPIFACPQKSVESYSNFQSTSPCVCWSFFVLPPTKNYNKARKRSNLCKEAVCDYVLVSFFSYMCEKPFPSCLWVTQEKRMGFHKQTRVFYVRRSPSVCSLYIEAFYFLYNDYRNNYLI